MPQIVCCRIIKKIITKDLVNSNSNFWRLWCREQVINLTINWLIKMTLKDDSYDSVHQMKHRKAFFTIYCYFSTINFYAIFVNANDQNINKNQDSCACAYCTGTFSAHIIKVHIAYDAPFELKRSLLCAKSMYVFLLWWQK